VDYFASFRSMIFHGFSTLSCAEKWQNNLLWWEVARENVKMPTTVSMSKHGFVGESKQGSS